MAKPKPRKPRRQTLQPRAVPPVEETPEPEGETRFLRKAQLRPGTRLRRLRDQAVLNQFPAADEYGATSTEIDAANPPYVEPIPTDTTAGLREGDQALAEHRHRIDSEEAPSRDTPPPMGRHPERISRNLQEMPYMTYGGAHSQSPVHPSLRSDPDLETGVDPSSRGDVLEVMPTEAADARPGDMPWRRGGAHDPEYRGGPFTPYYGEDTDMSRDFDMPDTRFDELTDEELEAELRRRRRR